MFDIHTVTDEQDDMLNTQIFCGTHHDLVDPGIVHDIGSLIQHASILFEEFSSSSSCLQCDQFIRVAGRAVRYISIGIGLLACQHGLHWQIALAKLLLKAHVAVRVVTGDNHQGI